jgi:hypothetical protein
MTPLLAAGLPPKERLVFASSRKIRPRRMFRQPMEKMKNAETRGNLSARWERICEPSLSVAGVSMSATYVDHDTYRHWKIPRAPSPKFAPSTGKKRSKKTAGQPSSETGEW